MDYNIVWVSFPQPVTPVRPPASGSPTRSDWFFSSLAAIYQLFDIDQVGCPVETLWNAHLRVGSAPFDTGKCIISKHVVIPKKRKEK